MLSLLFSGSGVMLLVLGAALQAEGLQGSRSGPLVGQGVRSVSGRVFGAGIPCEVVCGRLFFSCRVSTASGGTSSSLCSMASGVAF